MRVTLTGASGLIGGALVAELARRGAELTVLSRAVAPAQEKLSAALTEHDETAGPPQAALEVLEWDPLVGPAPVASLAGRDAVVHLAGESIAQRWSSVARAKIRESRVRGTANLVAGLAQLAPEARPPVLLSASAIGYYGPCDGQPLDEDSPAGEDFLAQVCLEWERAAEGARELGVRVVQMRTGVVLDAAGGALAKMLPPFRLGLGGPVAGGRQFVSWVHPDDVVGIALGAIENQQLSGPINATAPQPVTNAGLARALGRALGRPAFLPVPGLALRLLYGKMASLITTGARVMPAKALVSGYRFRYTDIDEALRAALTRARPPRRAQPAPPIGS
jgi:uncharacterized protein (TIGR01777 family)